jgi:hypothetical protein
MFFLQPALSCGTWNCCVLTQRIRLLILVWYCDSPSSDKMNCTTAPSGILMIWVHIQYVFPLGHWGRPSDPAEQSVSNGTSSGCVRGGAGGAMKEMLFTVALTRSSRGGTVGQELGLQYHSEKMLFIMLLSMSRSGSI